MWRIWSFSATPQSWNRYAYVRNNPLRLIDPDGREEIEFIVRSFIPQASLMFPIPAKGDNRNVGEPGTFRTEQRITIETDPNRNGGSPLVRQSSDTGTTLGIGFGRNGAPGAIVPVPLTSDKSTGNTLEQNAVRVDGQIEVSISGNESNPLLPSPGISFDFKLVVPENGGSVAISGSHDGFPAFEIFAVRLGGTPSVIFSFDPRDTGQTVMSLFGRGEFRVQEESELPSGQ